MSEHNPQNGLSRAYEGRGCDCEEDFASEVTVDNLEVLYEMLQTIFRGELGLVGTQLEMWGLNALMETMSEIIDKLTEDDRALQAQTPVPATQPLPPPPSTPPPRPKRPASAGEAAEEYLPHTNSRALCACRRGDQSRATASSTSAAAAGPAPRHGETDEGWKKVERRKGKGKKGVERKEGSVPSWADEARRRDVYVTGGNRDARPHKARSPKRRGGGGGGGRARK